MSAEWTKGVESKVVSDFTVQQFETRFAASTSRVLEEDDSGFLPVLLLLLVFASLTLSWTYSTELPQYV